MWGLLVAAALVAGGVGIYNKLVKLREQTDAAWADIDVQLKRRHDLIPNVVETVKGYAAHEHKTLEAVVSARSSAMSAQTPAQKGQAEGMLAGAMKSLFALAEAYPDLKANESFQHVQARISQLENAIADRRELYNATVNNLNIRIEQFPDVVVARNLGFKDADLLEFDEQELKNVDMKQLLD